MKINRIFFFLFLLLLTNRSQSQELLYQFENYSVNEGLPSSQIYDILQDQNGYIWIGTDRGLAMFNGYEFEIFKTEHGLSSDVIFKIAEDETGKIWVCGKNRKISFIEQGEIKSFRYNDSLVDNISNLDNVNSFNATSKGMTISTWGVSSNWVNKELHFFQPEKENTEKQNNTAYIINDELGIRIGANGRKINSVFYNGEEIEFNFEMLNKQLISSVVQRGDEVDFTV